MRKVDQTLRLVWELSSGNWSDEVEDECGRLLPVLIDAGYVKTYGHSRSGFLWRFTPSGVERAQLLGFD
jgi:hypothetical protein